MPLSVFARAFGLLSARQGCARLLGCDPQFPPMFSFWQPINTSILWRTEMFDDSLVWPRSQDKVQCALLSSTQRSGGQKNVTYTALLASLRNRYFKIFFSACHAVMSRL